jgi:hypothetical protein
MSNSITELVNKIARLEDQLEAEMRKQQDEFRYTIEKSRVRFEDAVLEAHRALKVNVLPWLLNSTLRSVISMPFIYGMIIPLAFMDITVTLYQHICFRLYNVARVNRSKYVVMDRHQLAYLNGIEKLNCLYCGYGNGVIAYAREIVARTEQYWCPIKHARRVAGSHRRYGKFVAYGDAEAYHSQLIKLRDELKPENME